MSETMTRYSKAPEKMKKYEDQQITSPITNRTRSLTYSLESKFRQPSFPPSLQTPRLPFITAFENKQHHNDTRRDNGRQQVILFFLTYLTRIVLLTRAWVIFVFQTPVRVGIAQTYSHLNLKFYFLWTWLFAFCRCEITAYVSDGGHWQSGTHWQFETPEPE